MTLSGQRHAWQPLRKLASVALLALLPAVLASWADSAAARSGAFDVPTSTVRLSQLPFDAQTTYRLIARGGPFPYAKDGVIFSNRERALPEEPRGFYREYTVRTPGAIDRGARRIVCGRRMPPRPETCFYTGDHYHSFQRILP